MLDLPIPPAGRDKGLSSKLSVLAELEENEEEDRERFPPPLGPAEESALLV